MDLEKFKIETAKRQPAYRELLKKLKKQNPRQLDNEVHALHEESFEDIDCLTCANCCKTTSPIFRQGDIERLSKALKMKVPAFIDSYLHLDAENDYVLNEAPCPFLAPDNTCIVYESRPTACREYPHTDRKKFRQLLSLSLKNTQICPAVKRIFDKLEEARK